LLEEIETEHFIPSLFADNESTSRAAVSKVIRQLLDQKLIQVAISQTDGRQRKYALSAVGKAKLAKLRAARNKAIESIWSPLAEAELAQFSEFMRLLIERIEHFSGSTGKE
jgi:DNA-binding MarR family transcriptional regulator